VIGAHEVEQVEEIKLSVPAMVTYSRVARLAIAGLASRLGFSYDEIEDLRIAVGEVCGVLLDEEGGRLTFTCRLSDEQLALEAVREPTGPSLAITDLTRQILDAVVDEAQIDPHGARITIAKRRRA
jgi:anti-sigma regulatory factor (Ser/Thr protein kinase)